MAEGHSRHVGPSGFDLRGSMSCRNEQFQWENVSKETSTVMNWLGYGPEIRQARKDAYRLTSWLMTARAARSGTVWITSGSKAEGLTCFLESDVDRMFVEPYVVCIEDGISIGLFRREITVFRSYSRLSYPGHCRLLLERHGTINAWQVNKALCDDGYGREILSSDLFFDTLVKLKDMNGIRHYCRAGPSQQSTYKGVFHEDLVSAIPYHCPTILERWESRPRHWPPPNVVQKVVSLGAFLTPVGIKDSEYKHVEWRICFNTGEIELVNNLNDTQVKLYALLKMVKTFVLKPCKKEITSYTIKNLVLWIAENNSQTLFQDESLIHWLHEGLGAVKVAIVKRELPYYMIPEKNLLAACGLEDEQLRTWTSTLTELMNEGPRLILRLPKIRQALIAHPETLRWYSRRRFELELLELWQLNRMFLCGNEDFVIAESDTMYQAILIGRAYIVAEVCNRIYMEGGRINDRNDVYQRMLM